VLKEIHAEMGGIEHVEKLMEETAEAVAYQNVSSFFPLAPVIAAMTETDRCWLVSTARELIADVSSTRTGGQRHARVAHYSSGRGRS
jgi:hypothetical protein